MDILDAFDVAGAITIERIAVLVVMADSYYQRNTRNREARAWQEAFRSCEARTKRTQEAKADLLFQSREKDRLIDRLSDELTRVRESCGNPPAVQAVERAQTDIKMTRENGVGHLRRDTALADKIGKFFDYGEARRLSRFLDVNPDMLNREGGDEMLFDLVGHLRRRNRIDELLAMLKRERPNTLWEY